jgi:septal ring factor EnvC (AmiA/AmiB activator)
MNRARYFPRMARWSDFAKKIALTVFDEKIAPLEKRVLKIERRHRVILHRLKENERRIAALEGQLQEAETARADVAARLDTIITLAKLLPGQREDE